MDRNTQRRDFKCLGLPSLSVRRAWIEMINGIGLIVHIGGSLSVRRAWIEIVDPDKDSLTDDGRSP